jgi:hypothetical protein
MTPDQLKKYEEAAKKSQSKLMNDHEDVDYETGFVNGATFAHNEQQIQLSNYAYQMDRAKQERDKAEAENEKLREALTEAITYISSHPAERIITIGEQIVKTARKLIEPGE